MNWVAKKPHTALHTRVVHYGTLVRAVGRRMLLLIDRRVIKLGLQAEGRRRTSELAQYRTPPPGASIGRLSRSHARVTRGVKSDPKNTQESGGGQT